MTVSVCLCVLSVCLYVWREDGWAGGVSGGLWFVVVIWADGMSGGMWFVVVVRAGVALRCVLRTGGVQGQAGSGCGVGGRSRCRCRCRRERVWRCL